MIPLNTDLSTEPEIMRLQLMDAYQQTANAVNGRIEKWTPELYGSTTAGTPVYSFQYGRHLQQGIISDAWFFVGWTGAGTCVGNIMMRLPSVAESMENNFMIFPTVPTLVSLNANYIGTAIQVISNTATAVMYQWSNASGSPITALTWAKTAARIYGHIRYPTQRDLSRR